MRWLERFRIATLMLFRRQQQTVRLDAELQFHLDQQVKENIARGLSPEEAHYAALRTFGNPALLRDQARSSWSWNWLEKLLRDLRYGARTLTRSPGFALTAILVMALGIGATTSLFTIVRAVLLKPLPFRDPDSLVMVYEHFRADTTGNGFNPVASADFNDWHQRTHGFESMAAWRQTGFDLTGEHAELPEVVEAAGGSWDLFSLLGTPLALGRAFTPQEDQIGANHVAILTWSFFQRRFAADPSVIGKQVRLDSTPYQIIGVLPRWFTYPDPRVQLWVPYTATFTAKEFAQPDDHQSYVIARLRPGVSSTAAVNEVSALQYQIHLAHPFQPVAEEARVRPMLDDVVADVKTPLVVLLCAVGCMLLIACLNVSNLLVARGAARRKELAVRGALGGSRLVLIAEQMAESLLICIMRGNGRCSALVRRDPLAREQLERSSTRGSNSRGHKRAPIRAWPRHLYGLARRLVARYFLNRRRRPRRAPGIIPVHWRQHIRRRTAQNTTDRGDRADGHSARVLWFTLQKLSAPAYL